MPYATYRFNKIIAAETIRFIVTVAIVVYKGLKLVVYRMLTVKNNMKKLLMINIIDEILLRKSALIEMVNDELNKGYSVNVLKIYDGI